MSFAFINIHLDIYRIIIIPHEKDRCFGNEKRLRRKNFFMLRCVRKEGKVFFAFGSKEEFRPQQSRMDEDNGNKIYYKVCTNLHKLFHNYITKISPEFLQESMMKQLSSFRPDFVKASASHTSASSSCVYQRSE
jgi:hypothetical protein